MSDQQEQQEVTIDDVWVNRLAQKIGILTAQNERLLVENESMAQQLKLYKEDEDNPGPQPPEKELDVRLNGAHEGMPIA